MATIGRELQPGDVVLVVPNFTMPMVDYYEAKLGVRLPTLPVPYDEATLSGTDGSAVTGGRPRAVEGAHGGRA